MIRGIDIYHGDGKVDFASLFQYGIQFCFVKATQGDSYTDPMFAENWQGLAAVGMTRGAYHFYEMGAEPVAQADFFLDTIGDLGPYDMLALDIEEGSISGSPTGQEVRIACLEFLQRIEERTGKLPIVYTDGNVAAIYALGSGLGAYPLWLARYRNSKDVPAPAGWGDWTFWQYAEAGTYGHRYDVNRYRGSHDDLLAQFGPPNTQAS